MSDTITPVCSHKARPATHSNATHGNQWWKRDVFHAADGGRTFCGRRIGDWLKMDPMPFDTALADPHFCTRCAETRKATRLGEKK